MTYSIGEFSRMGRVTVKALRLYHEKGLLVPDFIDPESGYRYYRRDQLRDLEVIKALKRMGFGLSEIAEALDECEDDGELIERLKTKKSDLAQKVKAYRESIREIEEILQFEKSWGSDPDMGEQVEEKLIPSMMVAGYRMQGRYENVGEGFKALGRAAGRQMIGVPLCLYHDNEYKSEGADFEPCFEVKEVVEKERVRCHRLPAVRGLSLLHVGPYETLGRGYARLFEVMKREGLSLSAPVREFYHKGPGMILKGNPQRYRTEIFFPVEVELGV